MKKLLFLLVLTVSTVFAAPCKIYNESPHVVTADCDNNSAEEYKSLLYAILPHFIDDVYEDSAYSNIAWVRITKGKSYDGFLIVTIKAKDNSFVMYTSLGSLHGEEEWVDEYGVSYIKRQLNDSSFPAIIWEDAKKVFEQFK